MAARRAITPVPAITCAAAFARTNTTSAGNSIGATDRNVASTGAALTVGTVRVAKHVRSGLDEHPAKCEPSDPLGDAHVAISG